MSEELAKIRKYQAFDLVALMSLALTSGIQNS
jgi:hypothetical protein